MVDIFLIISSMSVIALITSLFNTYILYARKLIQVKDLVAFLQLLIEVLQVLKQSQGNPTNTIPELKPKDIDTLIELIKKKIQQYESD